MGQIAFPARVHGYVICIGAATGSGVPSLAGFITEDPNIESFTVPGIGVRGASIRPRLGGYTSELRSGTSAATPIAAGVAVLFIEYSRLNNYRDAGSHQNMLKLFSAMSADSGVTYRLLCPWTLLGKKKVKAALDGHKPNNLSLRRAKG